MDQFDEDIKVVTLKNVDFKDLVYDMWIKDNYPTPQSARLQCAEATLAMVDVFEELKRVRGLAAVEEPYGYPPTRTPHWWCVTPDGGVIDPTAHQFPTRILFYEEANEAKGPPTGKCPNCGGLCYKSEYLCSDLCSQEYMTYLNTNND